MNQSTQPQTITQPQIISQQQDDSSCCLELYLPADLMYFQGHFPGQPILPGVTQLQWAIDYARAYLPFNDFTVTSVEVLKFQQLILPEMTITLTLSKTGDNKFTFAYTSPVEDASPVIDGDTAEANRHASGRIKVDG